METDPLNGSEHIITVVKAYKDVDLLIVYLGINDIFVDPEISVQSMSLELAETIDTVQKFSPSMRMLLLSPLPVNVSIEYHAYYHGQIEKSFKLPGEFEHVAKIRGCDFLDPSQVISASRDDGVHIEADEHIKLGLHVCTIVRDILRGIETKR
jgi:lysophospholipase L1-like esterase